MAAKRAPINHQKNYNMTASEYVKIKQIRDGATGEIRDGKMWVWQRKTRIKEKTTLNK